MLMVMLTSGSAIAVGISRGLAEKLRNTNPTQKEVGGDAGRCY